MNKLPQSVGLFKRRVGATMMSILIITPCCLTKINFSQLSEVQLMK